MRLSWDFSSLCIYAEGVGHGSGRPDGRLWPQVQNSPLEVLGTTSAEAGARLGLRVLSSKWRRFLARRSARRGQTAVRRRSARRATSSAGWRSVTRRMICARRTCWNRQLRSAAMASGRRRSAAKLLRLRGLVNHCGDASATGLTFVGQSWTNINGGRTRPAVGGGKRGSGAGN
jgi:hypothetical protein